MRLYVLLTRKAATEDLEVFNVHKAKSFAVKDMIKLMKNNKVYQNLLLTDKGFVDNVGKYWVKIEESTCD